MPARYDGWRAGFRRTRSYTSTVPRRVTAALGLLTGLTCIGLLLRAATGPGSAALGDYVSRLGEPGAAHATAYRTALLLAAATLLLLSAAMPAGRTTHPAAPAALAALGVASLLAIAGLLLAISGVVPCQVGCPVPLRQGLTSPANLVHFGTSGAVFVVLIGAMATVGQGPYAPWLRTLSRPWAYIGAGAIAVLALLMLVFAHGVANGVVERLLIVLGLGWVLVLAGAVAVGRAAGPAG